MKLKTPYYKQSLDFSCGPTSAKMVLEYYGIRVKVKELWKEAKLNENGTTKKNLVKLFRKYDFIVKIRRYRDIERIKRALLKSRPVIVNFIEPSNEEGHFAVVVGFDKKNILLNDPWNGPYFKIEKKEFLERWKKRNCWMIIVKKKRVKN
jgi:ABC-type bacteriocin/lantibiotic exporter with double-glycine peptidase domain